jgi:hypothetical protein
MGPNVTRLSSVIPESETTYILHLPKIAPVRRGSDNEAATQELKQLKVLDLIMPSI